DVCSSDLDPVWGPGLRFLMRKGIPEKQARSFLGKLKGMVGDIYAGALLADADAQDITDPIPWLSKAATTTKAAARKPSAADDFRGKTYVGTAPEDLPPEFRDLAGNG